MGASQVKQTLKVEPSAKDIQLLQQCFELINKEQFNDQLNIEVRWDYPSAVEPRTPSDDLKLLPPAEKAQVELAMRAYFKRDFATAKVLLEPFRAYESSHIQNLYVSILRHLKEPIWFNTSQSIWHNRSNHNAPAVASIELKDGVECILVSPALSSIGYKAPTYVLSYVIFHEGLHKMLDTKAFNPHPPLFRRIEAGATQRDEAVAWLRKHKFATIEDLA